MTMIGGHVEAKEIYQPVSTHDAFCPLVNGPCRYDCRFLLDTEIDHEGDKIANCCELDAIHGFLCAYSWDYSNLTDTVNWMYEHIIKQEKTLQQILGTLDEMG